jgi:hypothetical protein
MKQTMEQNPFLQAAYAVLPRVASFFDTDARARTYGVADRHYASWCTIDFANGTYQGAAFGLARLWEADAFPVWFDSGGALALIKSAFCGTASICRSDGSLEEAFPFERSFCVTALGAHDLLQAYAILHRRGAATADLLESVRPLIAFLLRGDERHGIISNHLATAAGALFLWSRLTGEGGAECRGLALLERIRRHASPEGWFREYDGADPGYQTLCLHYLVLLHQLRPDLGLESDLRKASVFLSHFAMPDGSFGGIYGSRRTRLYYPSSFALLAPSIPEAAALDGFMRSAVERQHCVTLAAMDDLNLVPMFNAYAVAGTAQAGDCGPGASLPCLDPGFCKKDFPQAGLLVRATPDHYTVISTRLGGAFETAARGGGVRKADGGSILQRRNVFWSTQGIDPEAVVKVDDQAVIVTCRPSRVLRRRPSGAAFICLRLLAATVMRVPTVSHAVKRLLAYLLISRQSRIPVRICRSIRLDGPLAHCDATVEGGVPPGMEFTPDSGDFRSIHMASAGYWQSGESLQAPADSRKTGGIPTT